MIVFESETSSVPFFDGFAPSRTTIVFLQSKHKDRQLRLPSDELGEYHQYW